MLAKEYSIGKKLCLLETSNWPTAAAEVSNSSPSVSFFAFGCVLILSTEMSELDECSKRAAAITQETANKRQKISKASVQWCVATRVLFF